MKHSENCLGYICTCSHKKMCYICTEEVEEGYIHKECELELENEMD